MYGVHAGGPPLPVGLSPPLADLETRLAAFLGLTGATVFPTGWSAGYGALRTLLRPADHVLIDVGAPACLQAGAQASTARVHRLARCDAAAVAPRLARLRAEEPAAGLLVVAAALRGTDSDSPDLAALQSACRDHHATLLVDVSEDLGAMGPGGRGVAAAQGMHGRLDVVCGSFAACLGADGGFVAGSHPALGQALRHVCTVHTASAALSPVAAAVVLAALEIVEGGEGAARRERLAANVGRLRAGLAAAGFAVAGVASPVVPVVLGSSAVARPLTARLMAAGAFVELLEHPAVARDAGRWRLRPMAGHSDVDIDEFVALASRARERTDD
jgi:glycine C-acetyltransferase